MSSHVGRLEHIDLPKKDFCLLAAIGLILRQSSGITPWSRGDLPEASSNLATEIRALQKIVTFEFQLGVRMAGCVS
jgi:hypothetical protein